MDKNNNEESRYGIISFWLAFIPAILWFLISIKDVIMPTKYDFKPSASLFISSFIFMVYLVSFILGIIGLTDKGYKKGDATAGVIMSGLVLLFYIITRISLLVEVLN